MDKRQTDFFAKGENSPMRREPTIINKQLKMIQKTFEERRNKHLLKYNLTSSQQELLFYLGFHEGEPIHQREIEKSRCLMQEMCEEMWQMDDKIYSCMTEEERRQLSGLLERILHSLSEV